METILSPHTPTLFTFLNSTVSPFRHSDIDRNTTVAVMTGNNTVGKHYTAETTARIVGKVLSVSDDPYTGTDIPMYCTVLISGIVRFSYSPTNQFHPKLGSYVASDGGGMVVREYSPHGRGLVVAIDEENRTCDVIL